MSEAYLIAGCEKPAGTPMDEVINSLSASAGIIARRLDEIHIYTDAASALFQRSQTLETGHVFTWPLLPLLPAAGLHSLCRSLETGEISLCMLAEISENVSSAVILAGPAPVGGMNLSPLFHLSSRISLVDGAANLVATAHRTLALAPVEIEPEEPVIDLRVPKPPPAQPWLAVHSAQPEIVQDWPENRRLHSANLCGSLLKIAKAMKTSKTDQGVWMSVSPDGPVLATLVMPL